MRIVELIGLNRVPRLHKALRVLVTFILVCVGWIFFRAKTLQDALYVLSHVFQGWQFSARGLASAAFDRSFTGGRRELALAYALIVLLLSAELIQRRYPAIVVWFCRSRAARWALSYAQIAGILLFGVFGQNQFIYFQF